MGLSPSVPAPRAAAHSRITALQDELAEEQEPRNRAALAYEIGGLTEHRLHDPPAALALYRRASNYDPKFRPALFALARLLEDAREWTELAQVLARTVGASALAEERAAALVNLGCLFEDRLGDPAAAADSFERALAADPGDVSAARMLERALRGLGRGDDADQIAAQRASHTFDPPLRAALAREVARLQAARGEIEPAIEALLSAVALRGRRFSTLIVLSELASEHGRNAAAARACEDAAALLAAHGSGQFGSETDDIASHLPTAEAALPLAAWLYRRAAQLYLESERSDAGVGPATLPDAPTAQESARRVLERACASLPDELVLRLEHADISEATGDLEGARASLHRLLERADPQRAAALHFRLAELSQRNGESDEAIASLRAGLALDPASPVLRAVLDDALLDLGALPALCDSLEARADASQGEDRALGLLRAAVVAERAGETARSLTLYGRAAELAGPNDALFARELYGAALRARDHAATRRASELLLAQDLGPAERSAVQRSAFDACLLEGNIELALRALRLALEDAACEAWAGHSARLMAGLRGDHALLAAAHHALSEQASEREQAAAHSAAEARALLRLGQKDHAVERFRHVLELQPADAYAVAALEPLLVERGEAAEAVHLLRESAAAVKDSQRSERALLHAALAAEAAGRPDLAASSFDAAIEKNPDSLAPLWLRLRMAERERDAELTTSALSALAERETRLDQAGIAQLELAERLDARGDGASASRALALAIGGERVSYEAAVSAALAPRLKADSLVERLRVAALGSLAQTAAPSLRETLEHEQLAELLHDAPADARTLLRARAEQATPTFGSAFLSFLLSEDASERGETLALLSRLDPDPSSRAELALAALRARALPSTREDSEDASLMAALALYEEAPESLAAALALSEAVSDREAPELRVTALTARLRHTPEPSAGSVRAALARALLDAERPAEALTLALVQVMHEPNDLASWECIRAAARRTGAHSDLVAACDELARHCEGTTRASLLEEAAAVLQDARQPGLAEPRLRAALEAEPGRRSAFEHLHDLLLEKGDLAGLNTLLATRLAHESALDPQERIDLLYARAKILRALGQRDAALESIRELAVLHPLHAGALNVAAEIHVSEQDWPAAVFALSTLARAEVPAPQRRLAHEGAADLLEHKLKDHRAAYAQLAEVAQAGLADVAVFTRMADIATRSGMAEEAVQALQRAAAASEGERRAAFERRAAIIYAQSLGRPDAAREALRRALAADPLDVDALEALHAHADPSSPELTSSEMLLHELWAGLRAEPTDPRLLRTLTRVGRLRGDVALQHMAIATLCALDLANEEERAALSGTRARLPALPSGTISEVQFALLGGPTHAHAAFRVARIVCRAAVELGDALPEVGRRTRLRGTSELFRTLAQLVRCFGLELNELHRSERDGGVLRLWSRSPGSVNCYLPEGTDLPLAAQTRFWLGAQCAALRLGVLPLVQGERSRARDLLMAAVCLRGTAPFPTDAERLRPLAAQLGRSLSRKERKEMEAALGELPDPLATLQEIADDARAGAYRAGTLLAVDVAPALKHVFGEQVALETVVNSKLGLRLLRFWTSQTCHALLRGLGISA